jgi:hypothetical protein
MKKITLALALFFLVQIGFSQTLDQYTFAQSNGSYTAISGGTVVGNTATDDERFVDPSVSLGGAAATGVGLPIGFNFVFNGFTYDRFAINANGWIALGSSSLTPAVDVTSTSSYNPLSTVSTAIQNVNVARIAAFARDLQAQAGSELRYQVLGTAPNRVLVVQWKNYAKYLAVGDSMNFQIRLTETANSVQFIYGTMTNNTTDSVVDCGLRAAPNAPATNFANRTSTTSWITTSAGATAANTMFISQTIAPASGLTYTWTTPPSCTGTPSPGLTIASSASVCTSASFTLSLQNATSGSSVSYQWMTSTDGINYANATGNATSNSYVTSQTVATYYKCKVTCTASGSFAESTPIQIGMNAVNACYCTPTYTTGKTEGDLISNIVINGTTLSNNSGTAPTNPAYTYFTGQPNYTANLQAGGTYTVTVTVGTFGGQNVSMWIDYNDNGVFEINERIGSSTTSINADGTATFTISLACNPPLGTHRMRVRDVWNQAGNTIDPCANYGYGEAEDYDIVITTPVACPQPSNVLISGITTTSATVAWTAGCTETQWMVYVVPAGSPAPAPIAGSGTIVNINPFVVSNLTPNTAYDIYLAADCATNGTSLLTGPIFFRTLIPAPANDDCANAIALTIGENITSNPIVGTNVSATNSNPPAPGCGGFSGGDVWYSVVVPATGNVTIETSGVTGSDITDTAIAVYAGDCNGLTLLSCDDDSSTNGNFSLITLNGLNPGQTLYINVWEYFNDSFGEFQISAYDCPSASPVPTGDAVQNFCGNGYTVANLFVLGSNVQWYSSATGGTPLNSNQPLVDNQIYYASQTLNCESFNRFAVLVNINEIPIINNTSLLICENDGNGQEIFDLTSSESAITNQGGLIFSYYIDLFDAENQINEITNATSYLGSNGELIYVLVQNTNGCFAISEVTLVVTMASATPTGNPTQDYCTSATLADLVVNGSNIVWYAVATGGSPLDPFTDLVDGATYFASQNEFGCESTIRLAVTVNDTCANVGCLTGDEYPTGAVTPNCSGTPQIITTAGWAGEYSSVNVTAGVQYTFSSSITTDFITIGNSDGSIAFASGPSPLVWTPTSTDVIRFYTHADASCTANTDFRTRYVACGTPPPTPVNDNCANPTVLTVGGVYTDAAIDTTSLGATLSAESPAPSCGNFNFATVGKDVWYSFVVPTSGNATIETAGTSSGGPGIDTVVQVYSGTCGALSAINCDDDGAQEVVVGHSLLSLTGLTPGATLLVRVFGYNGSQGNFSISVYDASLANQVVNGVIFTAYPNPVQDNLHITATEVIERIQVYNLVGQEMFSSTVNATDSTINLSSYPIGSYIVRAIANGQVKTFKVIKQ